MRLFGLVSVALIVVAPAVGAVDLTRGVVADEPVDVSYQATEKRLWDQGYRSVRLVPYHDKVSLVRFDSYRVNAFDPQRSEVLLTISMQDGSIMRSDYVHLSDQ